jgi:DNA repair protein RadC
LEYHATGIILGHNHRSGNIVPSDADRKITQSIANSGKILEIDVLDHIIVCETDFYSFADEGML